MLAGPGIAKRIEVENPIRAIRSTGHDQIIACSQEHD